MTRIFTLAIALCSLFPLMANKPIFVGHRGSLYGVENTADSFRNGAKIGYDYLETDVKVTLDLDYVCSHDDVLSRVGSSISIPESICEEVLQENLTQTRKGQEYKGHICTISEYLDICNENGVKPLIEFKYNAGINNNDFSNIPPLMEMIDKKGLLDKCIIITSMKGCLEYIKKNYPQVQLQLLAGKSWPESFDWCVKNNIGADIQYDYVDEETIKKFHDKGLKINIWTLNDPDLIQNYIDWGVDFITTDYYDPKQ